MTKEEKNLYNEYWAKVDERIANYNIKFDVWEKYYRLYQQIKTNYFNIDYLLNKMESDLLSADVILLYNDNDELYKTICMQLIANKVKHSKEITKNTKANDYTPKQNLAGIKFYR